MVWLDLVDAYGSVPNRVGNEHTMSTACEEEPNQIYGWRFYDRMETRKVNFHLLYYLTNSICELDDDSSRKRNKRDKDNV